MTDVLHTPGPWAVVYESGNTQIKSADGESLMCDETYYPWVPENPKDWDLIAAAPDLLSACEALLRFAENSESEFGIILGSANSARRAIAKAKGNV